jgi:prolyl-tRNA synthetase
VPAPTQIGVCVMVHGDNKGLVLPPRVAPVQVIIVWILSNSDPADVIAAVTETATQIERSLKAAGVRVKLDDRDNYLPGWKYAHWEQKVRWWLGLGCVGGRRRDVFVWLGFPPPQGVPLRIEVGPKDVAKSQVMVARRDTGEKFAVAVADVAAVIPASLQQVQADMLAKARRERDNQLAVITEYVCALPDYGFFLCG